MAGNPYALAGPRAGQAPEPTFAHSVNSRYTVPAPPGSEEPGYDTEAAPPLGFDETPSVPDPIRLNRREPPENDPNDREYWRLRTAEFHNRHSVEQTVTSWDTRQETAAGGQNPLWEQERLHSRPSAVRSPLGYLFYRPWPLPRVGKDVVGEDFVDHISMADHRREFEIFGMRSGNRVGTNTFRVDPRPWDRDLYPPDQTVGPTQHTGSAQPGNRSYRLG